MRKCVLGVVLSSVFGMADAANCDQARNSLDAVHCNNLVYQKADQELNETYKALMNKLKSTDKKALRSLQRQWIKTRDQQCTMQSVDMGEVIDSACLLNQTTERTNWLNDRLRECKTVGCISSKF
jgi:uncharacterized protein YecT (DUF1311 family)